MNKLALAIVSSLLVCPALASASSDAALQPALLASYTAEYNRDISGAIKALKSVEASEGDSYLFNYRLGWLTYLAGLWNDSVGYYNNASSLSPSSVEPLQAMLQPLAAAGKTLELLKIHERILQNDGNNYKSISQLAWLNYSAKDYKKASKFYARLLKLYPTDIEMLLGLAYSQKLDGNKEAADKTFYQVLMLSPKNARALAGLK